jgi:hypothetical protein
LQIPKKLDDAVEKSEANPSQENDEAKEKAKEASDDAKNDLFRFRVKLWKGFTQPDKDALEAARAAWHAAEAAAADAEEKAREARDAADAAEKAWKDIRPPDSQEERIPIG